MKPSLRQAVDQVLERRKLKVLDILCAESLDRAHKATQARLSLHAQVKACASPNVPDWARIEDTPLYVALVRSGMDCDGCAYQGDVVYVPATVKNVLDRMDQDQAYADGPIHHSIVHPQKARDLQYSSRDLTLEAFEDGHQWSLSF